MRFFARIAYKGTNYCGWQRQPNAIAVQQVIEEKLSVILQKETSIIGCGRTDAGVHASDYVFQFDAENEDIIKHKRKFNYMLPDDITVYDIYRVDDNAHARFDAKARAYEYHMSFDKSPFNTDQVYYYDFKNKLKLEDLNKGAKILLNYTAFFPFCKAHNDANTMNCDLRRCEWVEENGQYILHLESDRFLRGMVRLIVGMCINIANQHISIDDVHYAMQNQVRLIKDLSAPAHGLFLSKVEY